MKCPSCKGEVDDKDWLCPFCEHILDPSVLGVDSSEPDALPIREERTKLVAWDPRPEEPAPEPPEAMILGEVDVGEKDFSVVAGPRSQSNGRLSTFLFYTSGATSRILHPDAIPVLTRKDSAIPHTPYEDFILDCIDGERSVRGIQKVSGLAPQEVVITLLTLLDKGVIQVETVGGKRAKPDEEEATEDGYHLGKQIEDLPSVTDFEEVNEEPVFREDPETEEANQEDLLERPLDQSPPKQRAISDRPLDADGFVEDEDLDQPPVQPSELDESDSEMITDHSPLASKPRSLSNLRTEEDHDPPRPSRSTSLPPPPPPPSDRAMSPVRTASPPPLVIAPDQPKPKTVPPVLDPAFLVEVPKSDKKTLPAASAKRAPIEERDRRKPGLPASSQKLEPIKTEHPKVDPPPVARVEASLPKVEALKADPARAEKIPPADKPDPKKPTIENKLEPVDGVRMAKAAKLFEEALRDKADGNLVSARMNMKLALTFDPTNALYQQAFDELAKGAGANAIPSKMKSRARELYDQATREEEIGNVDLAIELLEKALQESKEAAYYNRLGVILAMKKKEFRRAQELIETALKINPGNQTYQHNLGKVLSMAATHDVNSRESGPQKKGGLLGFLGRKK